MQGIKSLDERYADAMQMVQDSQARLFEAESTKNYAAQDYNYHLNKLQTIQLLKDIRDGKVYVINAKTDKPVKIAFL